MRRPVSVVDVVASWSWFRRAAVRRTIFAALIIVLALLCVFPRLYVATVKLSPQQGNAAGLSQVLNQFGGTYTAMLGSALALEIDVAIGRSFDVKRDVVSRLGLADVRDRAATGRAVLRLEKMTDVQALRGNVLEVTAENRDRERALATATAYSQVMQRRLANLSREQTAYKNQVLTDRMREVGARLARAEAAVSNFRRRNQLFDPETQLAAAIAQISALRSQLVAKEVDLQTVLRFNSEESFPVKAARAAVASLRKQLAEAEARARSNDNASAASIAPRALEFDRLNRDLNFARTLFESYTRYVEGAVIEDLSADFNMQVIEGPFIEPGWQFNKLPLALLALVVLLALASEFFLLKPPVGIRPVPA